MSNTQWEDEEISNARLVITREQIMWYEWNIFLAIEAHCQEAIHPRWICVLAGGFFLSICLNDECVDHNSYKGEDQNSDLSHGQLGHNVAI